MKKILPYLSLLLIAAFVLAPTATSLGPFWISFPKLDKPVEGGKTGPDQPAIWQDLVHQYVEQGSDDAVVFKDITSYCDDPDDEEKVTVTSKHEHYKLSMNGNDIMIKQLDIDYTGTETVGVECNGAKNSFMLTVYEKGNSPARWKHLSNQVILQGSPDNTIVYEGLAYRCNDPDDDEVVSIESDHDDYDLGFDEDDLVIFNLDKDYTGTETVELECNGIYADFDLIIVSEDDYTEELVQDGEETHELYVGSIYFQTPTVKAGDYLPVTIAIENSGNQKLEDLKVKAIIQELAVIDTAKLDLSSKNKAKVNMNLFIPVDAEPGLYAVRFSYHNGDVSRVIYREIQVI